MADTFTANYGWTMPEVGASTDTWGTKLNDSLGKTTATIGIDAVVKAVSNVANAALPSASYTAADVLSKLLTVDGTGSLVDADKLDGNDSLFFGYRQIPNAGNVTNAFGTDGGKCYDQTGNITIGAGVYAASDVVSIYNSTSGNITLTTNVGGTGMRLNGTTTVKAAGGLYTIGPFCLATIWFRSATEAIISGPAVS
jgi:hypothetical protein